MAHDWQNWKRIFPSCYYHEIYRKEAVRLQHSNYTLKATIFVNLWNLRQFLEKNSIFCQLLLSENFFAHMLLILVNFFVFPSKLCIFSAIWPSVIQRSVSQENALKKSKQPSPFLHKTIGSNNCFTLIENNFRL